MSSKITKLPRTKADQNQYRLRCTEIGVGLTSFGALFMMLGIMLFFDGALLALGNVRTFFSPPLPSLAPYSYRPSLATPRLDPLPRRPFPHHRPAKDVLLFRAQEQATRDSLFPRRDTPCLSQMASYRCVGRDVRVSQSFWVRVALCVKNALTLSFFFPSGIFSLSYSLSSANCHSLVSS